MTEIYSFDDPALDVYARMTENQLVNRHEPEKGMFIAESPKVLERALQAGCRPVSVLIEKGQLQGEAADVVEKCGDIPVFTAEFALLNQLTGFGLTRGLLCAMMRPPLLTAGEVCRKARRLVVMENVMNPTNVGAIFRSAAAMGMDGVLLTEDCSDPLYRRAIRVSMGNVFQIPWAWVPSDPHLYMKELRGAGFVTAAMALREDCVGIDHPALKKADRLAVLMGSEGEGLKEETIRQSDYTVKIPMHHGVDSLNVAAASAVAFWEITKRHL